MSKFGVPTDAQLQKINKLAKRTLSKDEVFVFSGKSAGDLLIPHRYTRLSPELLKVMVDDAKKGVSFMLNHNWSNWGGIQGIPFGKVFDGRIIPSNIDGETVEMHLDKYIIRDDEIIDGVSANALIKRIETGVLSDTSIGFSTDVMVCSICGMNYWSGECSHYRGRTYELSDGTKKVCTVTAMPPSIILPNTNNALFEESIVWDGAYPGAVITQSKHGDIIETPSGTFTVLDDKEELPDNTPIIGHYHNGNIVTMVKKSEHKKIYYVGGIDETNEPSDNTSVQIADGNDNINDFTNMKGVERELQNEEKLKEMIKAFGIEVSENISPTDLLEQLAEKWDAKVEEIKASVESEKSETEVYMTQEQVKDALGVELSADEVLKLAKEGQEYRKALSDEAIAMGIRAMGNDFPKETWENSFRTMSIQAIKDIMKTWELQAQATIPAGRKTDPAAGQMQKKSLPDEAFKVGKLWNI